MRKQRKDRHTLGLEHRHRLAEMAGTKPDAKVEKYHENRVYIPRIKEGNNRGQKDFE